MSDDNNNDSECDLPEIPQQKLKAFNDFEEENIKKRNEIVDEYILGLDNKKEPNKNEETDEDDNDPFSSAAIKKLKKIKKNNNKQNENNFLKRNKIKSEQGKRKNLFDSLGTTNYKNDKKKFTENYYFNKFDNNNKTFFTPQETNNNYNLNKKSNSKSKSKEKKFKNNNNFILHKINKRNNTAKQLPRKNNCFNSIINNNINMNQIIYSSNNYNNNIIYNPIINNNFNNNNINQKKFFYNILNDQNNYFNYNNLELNKKELKEQLNQINKIEKIQRENQLENVYNLPKNILSHLNNNKYVNEVRKDIIEDSIEEEDDVTRKDKEIEFPLIYKYFK